MNKEEIKKDDLYRIYKERRLNCSLFPKRLR